MKQQLLQVQDLRVYYHTPLGPVKAVDEVTFSLQKGDRLGLVGESGCGKSTMAFALLRLIKPPGRIEGGRVLLDGVDLLGLSEEEMRRARFAQISLIPQGAMNSLNPVMRIRDHIIDTIKAHDGRIPQQELNGKVRELLERVRLRPGVARMFPHELSGGMKQRVCIAIAISLGPKALIADEPTSALDVVVQRQVMETLEEVQEELGASVILVGHDMGLMAQFVNHIGVMYAGKLVEVGPVRALFKEPLHPYTRLLISSLPSLQAKGVFKGIPGLTPSLLAPPPGCLFYPRCPQVGNDCLTHVPPLQEVLPGRWVACYRQGQI
ncbi:MAG: ABC transporter ATP-binding protein [Chloroflexota bacterium]|nr:ABC transporter ATP-binding protein [Chloroflexota bacterium]